MREPIRLSGHAREAMLSRGATEQEVMDAVRLVPWEPAEQGRMQCRKEFVFGRDWNDRIYGTKQVRPIFAEEADEIVVVTVYVYYF